MLVTFSEIKDKVRRALKIDPDEDFDQLEDDDLEQRINQIQDAIVFDRAWGWRKQTFYLTTRKPEDTGMVTVTENSRTVTGSGTSWDDTMRIGYLVIGDENFKINRVNSSTELILEAPYPNSTQSGASYRIVFSDYILNQDISSIISVKLREKYLHVVDKDRLVRSRSTKHEPQECAIDGITREDWYNTGTVTLTANSASVTGSGTAWTTDLEGRTFRVNEFSKNYTIKSVNSATTLTLTEAYEGDAGAGKSYAIAPKGSMVLTFRHAPDAYYWVEIEVLIAPPKLVSATAYSIIPNHAPLLHGVIWLAVQDFKADNPVRIQQARADFERTMKQLRNSYKAISNVRWTSPKELRARVENRSVFNPLESNRRIP